MKKLIIITLVLGALAPTAKSQVSDQGISGALLGGIAGGIIGHNNGRRGWEGALIGTGAGLLFGEAFGGNRRSYSSHSSYPYHRSHSRPYSDYRYGSSYPSYRSSYSYNNRYHDSHHCPQPRVIREVVERPVYIHAGVGNTQPAYYPETSYAYYPQPTVVQQPVVVVQQPVVIQQPVYVPQVIVVPQGGYRITY